MNEVRIEQDSLGTLEVPATALWGAQTQRAIENFPISGQPMPAAFIHALGLVKAACAESNAALGVLPADIADAIIAAAEAVARGEHDAEFPVDVFQTGSGTSTNMNANEVIAHLATVQLGQGVHPNDHVNASQSSNDVIPTAAHLSVAIEIEARLRPALAGLRASIERRSEALRDTVKTGRTHLMDAMPLTLGQELSGWAQQIADGEARLQATRPRLHALAQGGTAVGTGINAPPGFGPLVAERLAARTGLPLTAGRNYFERLSSLDTLAEVSAQMKVIACSLMKIANDLRWMNSGPLAGLSEIVLPVLQPGSSIMPGKVNPVIPEAVCMVAARVIGNDVTVTVAAQSGNFQLNVMWPVASLAVLESVRLLTGAARQLAARAIDGFEVRPVALDAALARNPILVTALNREIGYEAGARIAKRAYAEGRPVLDVALEETGMDRAVLARLLDPATLTRPG